MEVVNQAIGVDSNVLFVTCQAEERAAVSVRTAECGCGCGPGAIFNNIGLRRCFQSSTTIPGINVVYVRPVTDTNRHVTVYIENYNVINSCEISIQCIVHRDHIFNDEELERFNFIVRYGKFHIVICMMKFTRIVVQVCKPPCSYIYAWV